MGEIGSSKLHISKIILVALIIARYVRYLKCALGALTWGGATLAHYFGSIFTIPSVAKSILNIFAGKENKINLYTTCRDFRVGLVWRLL